MAKYQINYHVACQIQRKILAQIGVGPGNEGAPPLEPKDLASLTAAWEKLEERKRILRMKPLPKAIDVQEKKSKAQPAQAFSEA